MNQTFQNPLNESSVFLALSRAVEQGRGPVQILEITASQDAHLISELGRERKKKKLVITYDEARARRLCEDLSCFLDRVYYYPAKDLLFFSADIRSRQISGERIQVWRHMAEEDSFVVVTVADALLDPLEEAASFIRGVLCIDKGTSLNLEELALRLTRLGYERNLQVDGKGQFALRGGIADIYPLTSPHPIRIELWGEEVDSMRYFDITSQRSLEEIEEVLLYPAAEREVRGGCSFLSYWEKEESLIFLDEAPLTLRRARVVEEEFRESMAGRMEAGQIHREDIPSLFSAEEIFSRLQTNNVIALDGLVQEQDIFSYNEVFRLPARQVPSYRNAFDRLIEDLKESGEKGYRTVLLTASGTRAGRLAAQLREYGLHAYRPDEEVPSVRPGEIAVLKGGIHKGFDYLDLKFMVICESDLFGVLRKKKKRIGGANRISSLGELTFGDYVIHEENGLGIYRGLEKIEREGIVKDYIKIEYADGANCYVPATALDAIQKYADAAEKKPKLNRLGGIEWTRTKARVKAAVEDMARELVELYAHRLKGKGHAFGEDTVWQREFEEMFPYEETQDQIRAIEDVKRDMEAGRIMDRLICGDVGYGKTEIALRASFKVIQEGYQVIYLVPTTILAQQHYNTFQSRMKDFPVRVDMLSRFNTPAQQKKTMKDFSQGRVDIIVGTHKVLSKELSPKRLGLIIIDEEQRFGVKHKEALKQLRENVNVLTLTATPIPRTLHMSLSGIRDLSLLSEPPVDRQPIQTYVMEYHDEIVKEAIRRELERGGQVYYVYNRVDRIEEVASRISGMLPGSRVGFATGQMPEKQLETIMVGFVNGDIDVLVSTTIIETGLDIPNANTMIIQDADRFGLSQLYQLRGRVGRSARTAYAFFLYRRGKLLSEEAAKRLKAIREFTELGSGIKIAMRDLEIRGAGNVLGAQQHGHMQMVGYELYCKLLNTAVASLRKEMPEAEFETVVEMEADAYIPSSYIEAEEQKLDLYKRIASIGDEETFLDMQDELIDRFGEPPAAVLNLMAAARIKASAHRAYIEEVKIDAASIRLQLFARAPIELEAIPMFLKLYDGDLRIQNGKKTGFVYGRKGQKGSPEFMLRKATEILASLQSCCFSSEKAAKRASNEPQNTEKP